MIPHTLSFFVLACALWASDATTAQGTMAMEDHRRLMDQEGPVAALSNNTACVNATMVLVSEKHEGTFEGASNDFSDTSGCPDHSPVGYGVWYSVVGTGSSLLATACESEYYWITDVIVYQGNCDSMECVADGQKTGCIVGGGGSFYWMAETGVTYYILVTSMQNYGDSLFNVLDLPESRHDSCSNSMDLVIDGDPLFEAVEDYGTGLGSSACGRIFIAEGQAWYRVESPTDTTLRVSTCSPLTNVYTTFNILEGDCGAQTCIAETRLFDSVLDCPSGGNVVEFEATAGTTYHVVVLANIDDEELGMFEVSAESLSPPPNNYCEDAQQIISDDSLVQVDLSGATYTDETADVSCDGFRGAIVWYVVEGTGEAVRAAVCHGDFSATVSVFSGSCADLTCTAASTYDASLCESGGEAVTWEAISGTQYYVAVRASAGEGIFNLTLMTVEPSESRFCSGAVPVDPDDPTIEGSTANALAYDESNTCDYYRSPGIWYSLTGTGGSVMVDTCSEMTTFDTAISVYEGSCDDLACIGSNDDSSCGTSSSVTWRSEAAATYYVYVQGYDETQLGGYGLTVSTVVGPPNDACDGAIEVATDVPADGSLANAFGGDDPCQNLLEEDQTVWYFIDGTNIHLEASTCNYADAFTGSLIVSSGSSCDSLECVVARSRYDEDCNGHQAQKVRWFAEEGVRYYIVVTAYESRDIESFAFIVSETEAAPNDRCEDAQLIEVGSGPEFGSTVRAFPDDLSSTPCQGPPSPGVWYLLIGDGNLVRATTCSALTNYFVSMWVFRGSCGALECIEAGAEDKQCSFQYSPEAASWLAEDGVNYYVYVTGDFSDSQGEFQLELTVLSHPDNDNCIGARHILPNGELLVGSTALATDSGTPGCLGVSNSADVWYLVSGNGRVLTASLCDRKTNFDSMLTVYSGDIFTCENLSCVEANDDACGLSSEVQWFALSGVSYFIRVHGYFESTGTFGFTLTSAVPPPNDDCTGATVILANGEISIGSTAAATNSGVLECDSYGLSEDVWYQVQGTGSLLYASLCHSETEISAVLQLYNGGQSDSCYDLVCEEVSTPDSPCGDGKSMVWHSTSEQTYFIRVQGRAHLRQGQFGLSIEEVSPLPNDACEGAIGFDEETYGSIQGSTLGAQPDTEVCTEIVGEGGGVWYHVAGNGDHLAVWTCSEFTVITSVFRGSCGALECIGDGISTFYDCTERPSVVWETEEAADYYLLIQGQSLVSWGDYRVTVAPLDVPENNNCQEAILLNADGAKTIASTDNATKSDVEDCSGVSQSSDVWYKVEGTGRGLVASLCHPETSFDTALSVYRPADGSCGTLSCLSGNDDFCDLSSQVHWLTTLGELYYVRVHGYAFNLGSFGLTINITDGQENEACDGALPIEPNGTLVTGTTLNAFPSGVTHCFGSDSPDLWYKVGGTGVTFVASLCQEETDYDTRLSVYTGSCDSLECVVTNDDACGLLSQVEFLTIAGDTYWIRVYAFANHQRGDYGLTVLELPLNNECNTAHTLTPGQTVEGRTDGEATYSGLEACGGASTSPSPDLWYRVVGNGEHLTLSTCSDYTDFDTQISVYTTTDLEQACDSLNCFDGNDDACYSTNSEVRWYSNYLKVYYVRIHGYASFHYGSFELSLTSGEEVANDSCRTARLILPGDTVQGSTIYGNPYILTTWCDSGVVMDMNGVWYETLGDGSRFTATTCDDSTSFGTEISVYTGGCVEASAAMAYFDCVPTTRQSCDSQSEVEWQTTEGTVYYIVVKSRSTAHDTFHLTLVG